MTQDNAQALKNRLRNNDVLMNSYIEDMALVEGGEILAVSLEAGDEQGIETVKSQMKKEFGAGNVERHIVGEKEVEGFHGIYVR